MKIEKKKVLSAFLMWVGVAVFTTVVLIKCSSSTDTTVAVKSGKF